MSTTWSPDTCRCFVEYDYVNLQGYPVIGKSTDYWKCPIHVGVSDVVELLSVLVRENSYKNKVLEFARKYLNITKEDDYATLRVGYKWEYALNRIDLTVQFLSVLRVDKNGLISAIMEQFGDKVSVK